MNLDDWITDGTINTITTGIISALLYDVAKGVWNTSVSTATQMAARMQPSIKSLARKAILDLALVAILAHWIWRVPFNPNKWEILLLIVLTLGMVGYSLALVWHIAEFVTARKSHPNA